MFSKIKLSFKQLLSGCIILLLLAAFSILFFAGTNDSRRFRAFADELFLSELSDDTLSLHYTLAQPEEYGFEGKAVLSGYSGSSEAQTAYIEALLDRLHAISPKKLSEEDAFTYGLLERYLTLRLMGSRFSYYSEPLSPSSGMLSGLPILLADYTFRSKQDVEDYLSLIDQTDTYFENLITYEKEKAARGLFMSDTSARKVVEQSYAIMDKELLSSGEHFLHTTFQERLSELKNSGSITAQEEAYWISENDRLLTTVMAPAYEETADAFTVLSGSGKNDMGLYYFPQGQDYYQYLLSSTTGSRRSIAQLKKMLFQDFQQNLHALLTLLQENPRLSSYEAALSSEFPLSSEEEMLKDLQNRMAGDFPAFSQDTEDALPCCTIKSVSKAMENYCSPAYYLTPPIDDLSKNIIYINHRSQPDELTLYTTLAHEGYPGHLYQTVYSQLSLNNRNAPFLRRILHYGGYVEGWALYVEDLSYRYAKELLPDNSDYAAYCELCRLNRNVQLCLFSLLDIAIHYDGATLKQVQAILQSIGITDTASALSVYQYIVEEPATYPKYYVGFLEFQTLKRKAQDLWGSDFSDLRFHRLVLETGPCDFEGLEERLIAS